MLVDERINYIVGYNCFGYLCFSSCLDLQARVAAIFVFISFTSLLSVAGMRAHMKEIKVRFSTFFWS